MQQLANGTLLQGGKYRIEEKIGQGGFGITYRACQPLMLGRKVCIKEFCLKQHFSRESTTSAITYPNDTARKDAEMFQQKFIKEAQTLYSMRHPNIMEIYDIFEENNTAYYVMEYIEGESLKDMLEHRGCIPEAEAIGYIHKVAEALKYIHSRNINHFDVKPANILVRSSDKEVILIDFGTAKHYDSTTGNATTMTSGLLSPGYAPIEQYQQGGVSAFTPETDIYALGATLYKLLTGNTPPEPTEIISNGLPELPLTVSKATKDLVKWAMQLNKANRPHTCDEFLDSLPSELPDVTIIVSEESDADRGVEDESTMFIDSSETSEIPGNIENPEEEHNLILDTAKAILLAIVFVILLDAFDYGIPNYWQEYLADNRVTIFIIFGIITSLLGISMRHLCYRKDELLHSTDKTTIGVITIVSLVITILIQTYILGNGSNFQGGDSANAPLPGDLLGTLYKCTIILPIEVFLILSSLGILIYMIKYKNREDE